MPSIASNKQLVRDELDAGIIDHDAILAELENEIDQHNREQDFGNIADSRAKRRKRSRSHERGASLRFRFKDGVEDPRKKKRHHRHRSHDEHKASDQNANEVPHPFPREPVSSEKDQSTSNDAFLASLLDALQDDEAAAYWEGVYNEPIHTYERPAVRTESGTLEQMSDEEYANWVKNEMWKKQHPEVFAEQARMKQKREEEAAAQRKRKEDFVRHRQKEAWDRASRHNEKQDYEYVFDFDKAKNNAAQAKQAEKSSDWANAWKVYLNGWDRLKAQTEIVETPSKVLPWPTLPPKPPIRANIEAFLRNMPHTDGRTRQAVLKAERVRWHPDKIQQRFKGRVDDGTMKVVTGIFQIIDDEYNRSR